MDLYDYISFVQRNDKGYVCLNTLTHPTNELFYKPKDKPLSLSKPYFYYTYVEDKHKKYTDNSDNDEDEEDEEEEDDEDEDEENNDDNEDNGAILVAVSMKKYSIEDILSWSLNKFASFPKIADTFDWGNCNFNNFDDYRDVMEHKHHWWEKAIWTSKYMPDTYLITFSPNEYNALVLGKASPSEIPWSYYKSVYEHRPYPLPNSKDIAYNKIMNCSKENLLEYYNLKLSPINIPDKFNDLSFTFNKCNKLFNNAYEYQLTNTPDIFKSQLECLIESHIRNSDNRIKIKPYLTEIDKNSFCEQYNNGGKSIYRFRFEHNIFNGCIICSKPRWLGQYTCLDHENDDNSSYNDMIESTIKELSDKLEIYSTLTPPETIRTSFYKDGIKYNIKLELIS